MTKHLLLIVAANLVLSPFAEAQTDSAPPAAPRNTPPRAPNAAPPRADDSFDQRVQELIRKATEPAEPAPQLPRFDLDFPGGKPRDLVRAIEKATGKPLNMIIPPENEAVQLPAVSVKNVTVPQLFQVLSQSSHKREEVGTSRGGSQVWESYYEFLTSGPVTENSIWFLKWTKPPQRRTPETACQLYQLGALLDSGFTVEDITTAVETGWRMLGEKNPPAMSYHKDTKLLIAVGEPRNLALIGEVLSRLPIKPAAKAEATNTPPKAPAADKP